MHGQAKHIRAADAEKAAALAEAAAATNTAKASRDAALACSKQASCLLKRSFDRILIQRSPQKWHQAMQVRQKVCRCLSVNRARVDLQVDIVVESGHVPKLDAGPNIVEKVEPRVMCCAPS